MIILIDSDGRPLATVNTYPDGHADHLKEIGALFYQQKNQIPSSDVYRLWQFVDGKKKRRPECPVNFYVAGSVVTIADVPDNTTIIAVMDTGTVSERQEPITDHEIEVDEPGTIQFRVTPPWPYQERIYDIEIK